MTDTPAADRLPRASHYCFRMNPEALRCLLCKNARCSAACPAGTPVPDAMKLYREGRLEEAAGLLFENNPLSGITCQVCDWNRMCFGHCVLNARNNPVHWYEIENEISVPFLQKAVLTPGPDNGREVAVIGAGPAGIAGAIFLRRAGFRVTVYDSHERMGGVLRYGIPSFRLDKAHVDALEKILLEGGVVFRGGKAVTVDSLRGKADAILVATGAGVARRMNIPGEDLPGVISALSFLEDPSTDKVRGRVLVVGGGNVAMDACRSARRMGLDTTVYYRKTFSNMPANSHEVEEARAEGVKFELLQVPVAIKQGPGGNVAVIRDCENVTRSDGSLSTRIIDGTDHEVPFDTMIIAVSEKVDYGVFPGEMPLTDDDGRIKVNGVHQTSWPDVFMAGDFLLGPKTVVHAVQTAKTAVQGIIQYLG